MKIAWATPVNARSAIGRVSADVVRTLVRRGHEVWVIATDMEEAETTHPFAAEVVAWRDCNPLALSERSDVLIANLGDHYLYHGGVFAFFGRLPTLGIFHDYYLYDLFNGWVWSGGLRDEADQLATRMEAVRDTYGEAAVRLAASAAQGALSLSDIARELPMTEWAAQHCQGAIGHADFYLGRLRARCPGPVRSVPMPVTGRGIPPLPVRSSESVIVLTVGVQNSNKCADRVVTALAASAGLRARTTYRLVGPIEPAEAERLSALAGQVGYAGLEIHGAVSDDELEAHLADADVIACLRNPVLEGASGSAIEALLAGRPTLVADAGFYSELPSDLVFKVSAEVPVEELTARLEQLVSDEPLRRRVGAAARQWAERHFDLETYASAVIATAHETVSASATLRVGAHYGRRLAALGLAPDDPAAPRIAATLAQIFPVL